MDRQTRRDVHPRPTHGQWSTPSRAAAATRFAGSLALCHNGYGQVLLVTGPPCTGKTTALLDFAHQAAQSKALVLTATATRSGRHVHMGIVRQLLAGLPPSEERIKAISDIDNRRCPDPRLLGSLIAKFAAHRIVAICVDDLPHTDDGSLRVLLDLQRRAKTTRLLLVLTQQAAPWSSDPAFLNECVNAGNCRQINLELLTQNQVAEILSTQVTSPAAAAFHYTSGGNPMLFAALLDDFSRAAENWRPPDEGPAPEGAAFAEAASNCLRRAHPAVLSVAQALAVIGSHATIPLLAEVLRCPKAAVHNGLTTLRNTGFLDGERFRNPVTRSAARAMLTPERRSEMHLRAARALYDTAAHTPDIAVHLLAAGRAEEPWATDVLTEAARHALANNRINQAAACLRLAAQACPDIARRTTILAELVRAERAHRPGLHLAPVLSASRENAIPTSHGLSEAQRRVATKAALGLTNREIAAQLFVTVSTVEQHLTKVYRTLGISGRAALPTDLLLDA